MTADRQAEKLLVKSRTRLDELARELAGAELDQRGADDFWACCPFHTEDTPSFHLRPRLGLFKCFGCGESGDVFSFVQKLRGLGFREALEFLADRVGITLGSMSPEEQRAMNERRRVREGLDAAGRQLAEALQRDGGPALAYMRERAFTAETLRQFDIGFVPADFWGRLNASGLQRPQIEGMGFTRAFVSRVSFGIRDAQGALVGFGARTLDPEGTPKYVNTRETNAFVKSRLLYGLDKATMAVSRSRRVLVMEGYTDVMMAHQRGLREAVASMGTSLTKDHVRLLCERARNVVFVFDGDEAGQRAADRAVRLCLEAGLESRVLCLPGGQDPCDWLSRHEAEDFEELLAQEGRSSVAFLCSRQLSGQDAGQPGLREQTAGEILQLVRGIVDPVRRASMINEVARACGVDRNLLMRTQNGGPKPVAVQRSSQPGANSRSLSRQLMRQFVAVGGLATEAAARGDVTALLAIERIDHAGARRLAELGLSLAGAPIDPAEWRELIEAEEPGLLPWLDRVLVPPPDKPQLMSYQDALADLDAEAERSREQQANRDVLTRPDLARDPVALAALQDSVLGLARERGAVATSTESQANSPQTDAGAT